jgi:hypothetical protein
MSGNPQTSLPTIGFFTVVEDSVSGWTGGYLVLNALGRPLEFHCTVPVKANRAQEILYGPTLRPFLVGEQIGQALLEKSQLQPLFVCTDLVPALALRDVSATPMALILPAETHGERGEDGGQGNTSHRVDASHRGAARPHSDFFALGNHRVAVARNHAADAQWIAGRWQPYAAVWDLLEPFDRIREAIAEAQRTRESLRS